MLLVVWQIHELAIKLTMQKSQNAELRSQFEGKSYVDFVQMEFGLRGFVECRTVQTHGGIN